MSPEKEAFYTNFILIIRIETSIFRGDMLTMLVFGSVFFPKNHERTFSLGSCGKIHVCLWQWARQQTILLACQNQGTTRDLLRVPGNPEMPWLWCISHICLEQISIKLRLLDFADLERLCEMQTANNCSRISPLCGQMDRPVLCMDDFTTSVAPGCEHIRTR